jgi:Uma2 family endonuclease
MAVPYHSRMSVDEYLELDRNNPDVRYEYIDGYVRMVAGGSPNHAKIAANIIRELGNFLEDSSCSVYTSDVRVYLSETRYVYPDVVVSCDEQGQEREDMVNHPRVVVEVLSLSTEAYDRGRKLAYYRECTSVQEYVLVDVLRPLIEVFRRGKGHLWTYHVFGHNDELELASIDVRFPVARAYHHVVWPPQVEPPPLQ